MRLGRTNQGFLLLPPPPQSLQKPTQLQPVSSHALLQNVSMDVMVQKKLILV
jgi:hypothetical protein